jgi:hypothetical protein
MRTAIPPLNCQEADRRFPGKRPAPIQAGGHSAIDVVSIAGSGHHRRTGEPSMKVHWLPLMKARRE